MAAELEISEEDDADDVDEDGDDEEVEDEEEDSVDSTEDAEDFPKKVETGVDCERVFAKGWLLFPAWPRSFAPPVGSRADGSRQLARGGWCAEPVRETGSVCQEETDQETQTMASDLGDPLHRGLLRAPGRGSVVVGQMRMMAS